MALSLARKAELAQTSLPDERSMRSLTLAFLRTSGLSQVELADQIGYATCTLNQFIRGVYAEHSPGSGEQNSVALRAALKRYMDEHHDVFDVNLSATHETEDYLAVRKAGLSALQKGTAYLIDGPPGTQKTHILRALEQHIKQEGAAHVVYVYARDGHRPQSFLQEACVAAGIPSRGQIDQLLRKLAFFLGNKRTLLLVDEAQHLSIPGLEILRQLLDMPPYFGVMLAGSHSLSERLGHWQMEQWRSRLRKTFFLNGPSTADAQRILRSEFPGIRNELIAQTIADCTTEAERVRNGKRQKFSYISARELFYGIETTKEKLAQKAGNA